MRLLFYSDFRAMLACAISFHCQYLLGVAKHCVVFAMSLEILEIHEN